MERNIFEKQRELNDRLNRYRDEYYNRNAPSVSDEVYDRLFDELKELEQETGIQMANSPTQTVGYPAVSRLEKTRHEVPLLSLDKTKSSIPHVEENLDRGGFSMVDTIPHVCPCCGQPTRIHESSGKGENGEDRIIKTLYCDNPDCETRRLKKFVHFVSQKAMDIEGLSEATLEKFIGQGFIHSYLDIYRLDRYRAEIVRMDGFGEKSWQRLWDAIQQSRNTTFERYLISMDIPMIGNTASKVLGRVFHYDLDEFRDAVYGGYDFRQLPDFGETLHNNIHDWFCVEDNFCIWEELQTMMNIQKPVVAEHSEDRVQDNPFVGKTIVVTGKVEPYTRDGINDLIESLGAHAGSSVSKKTDYLVCGENAGSKLSKARDLGVTVLSPAEFFSMAGAE